MTLSDKARDRIHELYNNADILMREMVNNDDVDEEMVLKYLNDIQSIVSELQDDLSN